MKNIALVFILIVFTLGLFVYTLFAFMNEGLGIFQIFLSNILSLNWSGQFNLDFSCYLILSGCWIVWRNKFTPTSVVLAVLASVIGIMVFAPYLLWLCIREKMDMRKVLLGSR